MAELQHVTTTGPNVSLATPGGEPCDLSNGYDIGNMSRQEQCAMAQTLIESVSHPAVASVTFMGIIFNVIIIFVIRQSMRRRQTQAQIHLSVLAFSDIALGCAALGVAALSWSCDFCLPCSNLRARTCAITAFVIHFCWLLCVSINRSTSICIAIIRAKTIFIARNALKSQKTSLRSTLTELGIYISVASVLGVGFFALTLFAITEAMEPNSWQAAIMALTIVAFFTTIWMATITM